MPNLIKDRIDLIRAIRRWQHDNGRDDSLEEARAQVRMMQEVGLIHIFGELVYPMTKFSTGTQTAGPSAGIKHFQPMGPERPWDAPSIEHFKEQKKEGGD